MRSTNRKMLGLAAFALVLSAGQASAQGKGHGHGNGKGHAKGDDRRDDRGYVVDQGVNVPPGLAKKPGGMPPGQYKKRYSTSQGASVLRDILSQRGYTVTRYTASGPSQYVYYRDTDGRVRRAIVSPGTSQPSFRNVPAALLAEVLARLQ